MAVFGPALDFLLDHRAKVFPAPPLCSAESTKPGVKGDRTLPPHARGELLKREFSPTLELAVGLLPQTRQVVIVGVSSDFDALLLEQAKKELEPYVRRVNITYATALPLPELLSDLRQLPPNSIGWLTTFLRTARVNPSFRTMWSARLGGSERAATAP